MIEYDIDKLPDAGGGAGGADVDGNEDGGNEAEPHIGMPMMKSMCTAQLPKSETITSA